MVLPKKRLDRLVRQVAALYRKAHVTADEARYVHRRARVLARDTGAPASTDSSPLKEVPHPPAQCAAELAQRPERRILAPTL